MNRNRIFILLLVLLAGSLACQVTYSLGPEESLPTLSGDPIFTIAPQVNRTSTPEINSSDSDSNVNPTSQPTDTPKPSACLVGSWQASNLGNYILSALPQEVLDEYQPAFKSESGELLITFGADGSVNIAANQFELVFDTKASVFTVALVVRLDGTINGQYYIDGNTIVTSNMNTSQMKASARALGQDMFPPEEILPMIPLVEPPFNAAYYQCSQQTLSLQLTAYPDDVPPVNLQRIP